MDVAKVLEIFGIAADAYCEEERVDWGKKFRLAPRNLTNPQGVIALELWLTRRGNQVGFKRNMYCWALYVGVPGMPNGANDSTVLRHNAGLGAPFFVSPSGASVFELAPLPGQAQATDADVLCAARVAAERVRQLV
jgi:hypothetical protein